MQSLVLISRDVAAAAAATERAQGFGLGVCSSGGKRMHGRANGIHIRGWSFTGLFLGSVHRSANLETIVVRGHMRNMLDNVQRRLLESSRRLRSCTCWEKSRACSPRWCSNQAAALGSARAQPHTRRVLWVGARSELR